MHFGIFFSLHSLNIWLHHMTNSGIYEISEKIHLIFHFCLSEIYLAIAIIVQRAASDNSLQFCKVRKTNVLIVLAPILSYS